MASIRRRGDVWQVQVRRRGVRALSRTFLHKRDAEIWARQIESTCDSGHPIESTKKTQSTETFGDLIRRYATTLASDPRPLNTEKQILGEVLRKWLADCKVSELNPETFARYRDQRLRQVGPATVRRELTVIQRLLQIAIDEWGLPGPNPVGRIRKPSSPPSRERRLNGDKEQRLIACARQCLLNRIQH